MRSRLLLWIIVGLAVLTALLAIDTVLGTRGGDVSEPHHVHSQ